MERKEGSGRPGGPGSPEQGRGQREGAPSSQNKGQNKDITIEQIRQGRARLEEFIRGLSREDKKKLKSNFEIFLSGKTLYRYHERKRDPLDNNF
jgi:hypothetical protein